MGKKEIIIGVLVVLILLGVTYLATQMAGNSSPSQPTNALVTQAAAKFNKNAMYYFWGDGCPHCEELSKWLTEKGYDKTIKFTKLEVWKNKDNAALMDVVATYCKANPEGMGVPFVYYKGNCYTGTPDAESAFEQAAKEQ